MIGSAREIDEKTPKLAKNRKKWRKMADFEISGHPKNSRGSMRKEPNLRRKAGIFPFSAADKQRERSEDLVHGVWPGAERGGGKAYLEA
jgi:hypothetical protein